MASTWIFISENRAFFSSGTQFCVRSLFLTATIADELISRCSILRCCKLTTITSPTFISTSILSTFVLSFWLGVVRIVSCFNISAVSRAMNEKPADVGFLLLFLPKIKEHQDILFWIEWRYRVTKRFTFQQIVWTLLCWETLQLFPKIIRTYIKTLIFTRPLREMWVFLELVFHLFNIL